MKAGTLLFIVKDTITVLEARAILTPAGEFDDAKLDTLPEDLELVTAIEAILTRHGVHTPDRIAKILQLLPLVAGLVK